MRQTRTWSLRRRLMIHLGMMIVGLLLLSCGAIVGINGLHQDLGQALRGYQQLRAVYEVGQQVATARTAIGVDDRAAAVASIRAALLRLDTSEDLKELAPSVEPLRGDLRRSLAAPSASRIDAAMAQLAEVSTQIRTSILRMQQAAEQRRRLTLAVVIGLCIVVIAAGIVIGLQQYRAVMRPLSRISGAVRAMAGAMPRFEPIDPSGDSEFATLARDFNHMAAQLDTLYRDLEQKVAIKSRELVRSERLASVGFLAAGVAHEINNPLSIITGYGERALQQLDAERPDRTGPGSRNLLHDSSGPVELARSAIVVMCEEAFRCKQITDRLLSLARPGTDALAAIDMHALADEVVSTVGGLPEYRDRQITLESTAPLDARVMARDGEMKQVIMNLIINALQAVEPRTGCVGVALSAKDGMLELTVTDNGQGMTRETIEQIFEPFFTTRRGAADPLEGSPRGIGLGLSITHAIVSAHGGRITAESAGPGLGSRFIVWLPLIIARATEGAARVDR